LSDMKHLSHDKTGRLPSFFSQTQSTTRPSHNFTVDRSSGPYHRVGDMELSEAASPAQNMSAVSYSKHQQPRDSSSYDYTPDATLLQRQDSGYGSYPTSPRTSSSHSRPAATRRISSASSIGGQGPSSRPRTRPSTRRSAQSYQHYHQNTQPLYLVRSNTSSQPISYFHFPSPEPLDIVETAPVPEPAVPHPPQTTHYWTSDSTRRLEYAAIDAAGRGVKGWIKRNLVPDCFAPKHDRHISFDDDTGSVRRYRLDLEDEPEQMAEVNDGGRRRKGW